MCEKIIFHIDVNAAFLSWEAVYRLRVLGGTKDLRDIPCAVAGDVRKRHGIILAKSTPAKRYGIQTGELIGEALKKCPGLELVPPHYDLYDTCSAELCIRDRENTGRSLKAAYWTGHRSRVVRKLEKVRDRGLDS